MRYGWMIFIGIICLFLAVPLSAEEKDSWRGVHVPATSGGQVEGLTRGIKDLAEAGINTIVVEINYGYEYASHPELRGGGGSTARQIKRLVAECRKYQVRLIPQFQCLGHQSWDKTTYSLLTRYPQFDETPGKYPGNKGIYCRSWCPRHPEVNPIIFALMDELIDVFEADALHVGMDEVFLIGDEDCARCRGASKAELFTEAVKGYHDHLVGKRKIEMLMWGDRLIDAGKIRYGRWEASANGTAGAVDLIPKDIVICDWHYETRNAYESIPMFLEKGFRVWPGSWKNVEAARALVDYSRRFANPGVIGHLNTIWGAVPMDQLAGFAPLKYAVGAFRPLRLGVCADVHKDIMPDADKRLGVFIDRMNREKMDFIIQLGDFCRPYEKNQGFLDIWNGFEGDRYHVLGNHDTDGGFTREQTLAFWGAAAKYYSFDKGGYHFIVLDGNDKKEGAASGYPRYIGAEQREWVKKDLAGSRLPVMVFSHQSIENAGGLKNGAEIREIFESVNQEAGFRKVIACFSGHHHADYVKVINDIYYVQINSMSYQWLGSEYKHARFGREIEEAYPWVSATAPYQDALYAIVTVNPDRSIRIDGVKSDWIAPGPAELGVPVGLESASVPWISDRVFEAR